MSEKIQIDSLSTFDLFLQSGGTYTFFDYDESECIVSYQEKKYRIQSVPLDEVYPAAEFDTFLDALFAVINCTGEFLRKQQ